MKYREQDILKLTTSVNKLEQQMHKLEEENVCLKQQTGVTDVQGLLLTTNAKEHLKDQLEMERLRSLNSQVFLLCSYWPPSLTSHLHAHSWNPKSHRLSKSGYN